MSGLDAVEARVWALLDPYRVELEALLARLYVKWRARSVRLPP
jgi:hypothetical protein